MQFFIVISVVAFVLLLDIIYCVPSKSFFEQFTGDWASRWKPSEALKVVKGTGEEGTPHETEFKFNGEWSVELPSVYPGSEKEGLVAKSVARHHAISCKLDEPFDPKGQTLVFQYEVKLQNFLECGGAYVKLLKKSDDFSPETFHDGTPYTIMFGPDKCGATNKVHFIFKHKNPLTGEYEEKHLQNPPAATIDKKTNLYTLIVEPNNDFKILKNNALALSGNLLKDFEPAVNPPAEVDDPNDQKPQDWVTIARIPDPEAKKPEDWDEDAPRYIEDVAAVKPSDWLEEEPEKIPDPEAQKPEQWVDAEDGEWEARHIPNPKCANISGCGPWKRPLIKNPAYKGKWFAPLIDNPAYKGEWAPRKIPNPAFFEDLHPANFEPIGAIGFEIWTMQNGTMFDNIYLGNSVDEAAHLATTYWAPKYAKEEEAEKADRDSKLAEGDDEDDEEGRGSGPGRHFAKYANWVYDTLLETLEDLNSDFVAGFQKHYSFIGILVSVVVAVVASLGVLASLLQKDRKGRRQSGRGNSDTSAAGALKGLPLQDKTEEYLLKENSANDSNSNPTSSSSTSAKTPSRRSKRKVTATASDEAVDSD